MKRESLRLEHICYRQHGQKTLDDLSLALYQGEILGVLSDHAAEKNALVGIVTGHLKADSGRLYLGGQPRPAEEADPLRRREARVIHAAKTLVDDLSISENIFVIRTGFKAQIIDSGLLNRQTQQLMEDFGLDLPPKSIARNLSPVERCSIEIMKAIALGAHVVILLDLSSFLSDFEVAQLLALVNRLRDRELGFLMIDSALRYLASDADRIAVIRQGRHYWTFDRQEIDERAMEACLHHPPQGAEPAAPRSFDAAGMQPRDARAMALPLSGDPRPKALVFDDVSCGALESLSFTLHAGEELCLFDREGRGIECIKALLSGEQRAHTGRILVDGERFTARNVWQALDQKIAFVVENPADTMLFPDFTALENLCYPTSKKTADFWISPIYQASCLKEYSPYFEPDALRAYPHALSAQDAHKLIYCRWHLYNPRVVVCIKPFSSVEKSLEAISAFFIGLLLQKGIAVLILTSNAAEADRPCRKIALDLKNTRLQPKNAL